MEESNKKYCVLVYNLPIDTKSYSTIFTNTPPQKVVIYDSYEDAKNAANKSIDETAKSVELIGNVIAKTHINDDISDEQFISYNCGSIDWEILSENSNRKIRNVVFYTISEISKSL